MQRRHLFKLLFALPLLGTGAWVAVADTARPRDKVVFHVNRGHPDYQEVVLRNLHNHVTDSGPADIDIKVLLHGAGVALLLLPEARERVHDMRYANATPAFRARIDALRGQGVQFLVSAHTLQQHGIDRQRDLYRVQPEDLVDNALAHLTRLQRAGYTYIKP